MRLNRIFYNPQLSSRKYSLDLNGLDSETRDRMSRLFDAGYNNGVMDGSQYLLDKLIEFRKEIREIPDKRPLHIGVPPDLMIMATYGGELPSVNRAVFTENEVNAIIGLLFNRVEF